LRRRPLPPRNAAELPHAWRWVPGSRAKRIWRNHETQRKRDPSSPHVSSFTPWDWGSRSPGLSVCRLSRPGQAELLADPSLNSHPPRRRKFTLLRAVRLRREPPAHQPGASGPLLMSIFPLLSPPKRSSSTGPSTAPGRGSRAGITRIFAPAMPSGWKTTAASWPSILTSEEKPGGTGRRRYGTGARRP